jgi:hypothetical protein
MPDSVSLRATSDRIGRNTVDERRTDDNPHQIPSGDPPPVPKPTSPRPRTAATPGLAATAGRSPAGRRPGRRQPGAWWTVLLALLLGIGTPLGTAARSAPPAVGGNDVPPLATAAPAVDLAEALQAGVMAGTRGEINRLPESSAPRDATRRRLSHPASVALDVTPPAQSMIACADLWGQDLTDYGLADCAEYTSETMNGAEYRVYYPAEWMTDPGGGWGTPYLDTAVEAIHLSAQVYGALGTMGAVNFIFAGPESPQGNIAQSGLVHYLSDEPCGVLLYPESTTLTPDRFSQIVAHELFHCFQHWNFPDQMEVGKKTRRWWDEGTAMYFSNVVYPTANEEWTWIDKFDEYSVNRPLTQLAYEDFVFFQYLGNTIGDKAIINLIGSLPDGGGEAEQQAALAAYPNFAQLYQAFAQAYLDGAIADTSGQTIPIHPHAGHQIAVDATQAITIDLRPFVLERRMLTLAPGLEFEIGVKPAGAPSEHAGRPPGTAGGWAELPSPVDCDAPRQFQLALTSTAAAVSSDGGARIDFSFAAAAAECEPVCAASAAANTGSAPECPADPCLVGKWRVTDIGGFLQGLWAQSGATGIAVEDTDGRMVYTFGADGSFAVVAKQFAVTAGADTAAGHVSALVTFHGAFTGTYEAEGGTLGLELDSPGSFTITVDVFIDGAFVSTTSVPPFDLFQPTDAWSYACAGDGLDLSRPEYSDTPIVLTRVEK